MSRRDVENDEVRRKDEDEDEDEYEVQDLRDRIKSSRGSRFDLIANELGLAGASGSSSTRRRVRYYLSRESVINGVKGLSKGIGVIHPDNRSYHYSTSSVFFFLLIKIKSERSAGRTE